MYILFSIVDWIEKHPVVGSMLLTVIGATIVGVWKILLHLHRKKSEGIYITPVFYTLGEKYVVIAVHEYISSQDSPEYKQIQHSLPGQWDKLIIVKTGLFGFRHEVVPVNPSAHLAVVIRTTRKGKEKIIRFNW